MTTLLIASPFLLFIAIAGYWAIRVTRRSTPQ